jgi:glycine/D-amino acid oxidase-like deaminating enzyme
MAACHARAGGCIGGRAGPLFAPLRQTGSIGTLSSTKPHVVVVGAGIIGASIAWHLARAGAGVTIVEADAPGGVATPNSFSWINSNYSFARPYFELRHRSMAEWRRLAADLPALPVSFSGSLYLPQEGLDLDAFVAQHSGWGYRISLVDGARVRALEPALARDVEVAARAEDEAAVEASEAARALIAAALDSGARLRTGRAVDRLACSDGRVTGVRIGDEVVAGDEIVIAAGTATPDLIGGTGFDMPLRTPPGLLAHTRPLPPLINGVVLAEGLHVRQKADGGVLLGADFQGGGLEGDRESGARELMRRFAALFAPDNVPALERTTTGYRPTPADGVPVIGRVPGATGLYAAVMHSGVTLAPAVGLFAAREIIEGVRDPLLAPFGPERFAGEARAAAGK